MDTLRAGSNVDAWCTKCKLMLAHTIEAVVHGNIKRVQCNTCRGKHQYKGSEPGTIRTAVLPKGRSASPKKKSRICDFSRVIKGKDLSTASGYSITCHFTKGELIDHQKFGLGVVVDEKDSTKIEVLFESGPRVLVRAPQA